MRYPIHKQIYQNMDVSAKRKVSVWMETILLVIPYAVAFAIFLVHGEIKLGILILLFGFILLTSVMFMQSMPKTSGYLKLEDDILFHNTMNTFRHKRYQYSDISCLYVGDCPKQYVKPKSRSAVFTEEEWRSLYGTYIVALDKDGVVMFVCSYCDSAWDFLLRQCRSTIERVMTEEEWLASRKEQSELEKKTEDNNGYWEIVKKYDDYIN